MYKFKENYNARLYVSSKKQMDYFSGAQDTREIKHWLAKIGLQQYYSKFMENGVTFDLLPELDSMALREIGIFKVGDRIKLELAIAELKAEKLGERVSVDDLYSYMELPLPGTTVKLDTEGKGIAVNSPNYDLSSANLGADSQGGSTNGANSATNVKDVNKTIGFILQDGSVKKVNVTGCFNAQSIKRKVLKKLGFKLQEVGSYDTYIHSLENDRNGSGLHLLFDIELVTICYSPDRLEKHRIIFCAKDEVPSEAAINTSKRIMMKYERYVNGETLRLKPATDLSQYRIPEQQGSQKKPTHLKPTLRNFFGQRPPSELISSNLAEYFPEAHQKDLEATIRNSLRYSVRLSRRFNFPPSALSGGSGNAGFNNSPRFNTLGGTTQGLSSNASVNSGDQTSTLTQRKPSGKTIGEVMVSNIHAIDEAMNQNDTIGLSNRAPSIKSEASYIANNNADLRSLASNNSLTRANPKQTIAACFVDSSSSNNRNSRIELLNIDSDDEDEEEDIFAVYGTLTGNHLAGGSKSTVLDSVSDDGPKNWLQGARIGAGSFGTVYLGMNPFSGELMAVKQVRLPDKAEVNNSLQTAIIGALQHEMSLLKQLNHENIVRYLGSSVDQEFLNIFLEYVPGGSVQSMLSSYGPFEEPLIRNFVRQVLIGLSYLHGEDIIHRDIKGANILIDIKGTVKISDFGISKKVGSSDVDIDEDSGILKRGGRRASLQGSVYWMAPEVVKQTAYTKKADIWSVGCLIVEMFTGKHPFPDFSQMQAIFKIGTHITPLIPEWCTIEAKEFLDKTFEIDYEKRPDAIDMLGKPFLNPLIMSKQ